MTVYLVGAGPGDPGLITVRGREVLSGADVVVYDALAEESLLDLAPANARRVDVGKRPGRPVDQEVINQLLVDEGRAGRAVVRLKGGDPFVFGRGGEEAEALISAGVPFEVVPGVSSAIAAAAYAGVPVTHRGVATSFTVVTGHSRHAVDTETNWEALAAAGGTIVVLMGVAHRAEFARRLMEGGLAPATPVAAVRWGTRPDQETVRTTLVALADEELEPPAVIVIGAVAGLDLAWFERRPLFGRTVVVTRAAEQSSRLAHLLHAVGAETVELPLIRITDPDDDRLSSVDLSGYDWVVFTSTNAVERVFAVVRDARAFGSARVAAVGPATAEALEQHGIVPDLVPSTFAAESVVDEMPSGPGRVFFPRAAGARDVIRAGLAAKGWTVDAVDAYVTVPVVPTEEDYQRAARADAIVFTSSSTVTNYGPHVVPPVVACIGQATAATAAAAGIRVDVVPEASTLESLVEALARRLGV